MKPAVITPYYQESLAVLKRCHLSVHAQTTKATHILVADGNSKAVIDQWDCQHLVLPQVHRNCGNTPRTLGALMAASQGYEPIFFLDADNWFKPNHVELALALHRNDPSIDVVISSRTILLDDGSTLDSVPEDEEQHFADTSSLCFFKKAYRSLPLWTLMPNGLAPICDRVVYESLKMLPLKLHWHNERTMLFESHYANHYQLAGKKPKSPLHDPNWEKLRADLPMLLKQFHIMTGLQLSSEP